MRLDKVMQGCQKNAATNQPIANNDIKQPRLNHKPRLKSVIVNLSEIVGADVSNIEIGLDKCWPISSD